MSDTAPAAIFQAKHPYNTYWLSLEVNVDNHPQALLDDLAKVGWTVSRGGSGNPLRGRETLSVAAKGSDLFGSWTADEKKRHLASARKVLKKYGFGSVPLQKLTLAALL